jgi:poly(A) polymerase
MPIITPAYPSMCSTHNIMGCTLEVMKEELRRGEYTPITFGAPLSALLLTGQEVTGRIFNDEGQWSELFEKHIFFSKYQYYLQVISSCCDKTEQSKWYAFLVSSLVCH